MSSLDLELDDMTDRVEAQWLGAYARSAAARTELQALDDGGMRGELLEHARQRLARLEAETARMRLQIAQLERRLRSG